MITEYLISIEKDLQPLVPQFMRERKADIVLIEKLWANSDYISLQQMGISLRRKASEFGFDVLVDIANEIEQLSVIKDRLGLKKIVTKYKRVLNLIKIQYV